MVENAVGILRDVEIRETVAIIVTNGDAHAVGVTRHAGFLCHVGKCAVAIVVVERVSQRLRRLIEIARPLFTK